MGFTCRMLFFMGCLVKFNSKLALVLVETRCRNQLVE